MYKTIDKNGGPTYIVDIEINQDLSEEQVAEIFEEYFEDDIVLHWDHEKIVVIWQVPPYEGGHEIENALYYQLKNGEYGTMSYSLLLEGNEPDYEAENDEEEMDLIDKAIQFATVSHAGQTRKGTEIPYILHCLEAGTIAASLSNNAGIVDSDVVAAAILHDTIEDAGISYETLKETFNERIADLVQSQSEDKSKTWQERKDAMIAFLKENKSKAVEMATLGDKLSNMRAIAKDYDVLKEDLWDKFNAGKESQHWYYKSIAEAFTQVTDTAEYREYVDLIKGTFEN